MRIKQWACGLAMAGLCLASFAVRSEAKELPVLKTGFIFTTHHTPFLVAAAKGEAFKSQGVWLKPVAERQSYELMVKDRPVALLDLVVAKSGSETATLFAQKHLDIAIASITAIMAGIDKGTPIKIVCPLQTEGMALIAPKNSPLNDWAGFMQKAREAKEPVKVGFHSPTSAPKIVLEGALRQAGLKVTLDPSDLSAQILLVDLKETGNLLASLSSGQVDAVVGPSPFPEVAQSRGLGKVVINLRDLPPAGQWSDFPCCVGVASEEAMQKHPEVVAAFVELIMRSNAWSNAHREEAGEIAAQWIGMPPEAGRMSTLVFLNEFSPSWLRGAGAYLDILNSMRKFNGTLKDVSLEQAKPLLFETRYLNQVAL